MPDPFTDENVSETVQTVQEEEQQQLSVKALSGEMFFELAQADSGDWNWGLWTSNGKLLAMNAHPYKRRNDARQGIDTMMEDVQPGMKVVVRDRP